MRDPRFVEVNVWDSQNCATPEQIDAARNAARDVAAGLPEPARLSMAADAVRPYRQQCLDAFFEEFFAEARATVERRAAWVDAYKTAVVAPEEQLEQAQIGRPDKRAFEGMTRRWREERDPFALWARDFAHIESYEYVYSRVEQLIRIDPGEGLRVLDGLRHPGVMQDILSICFREDRAFIEEALSAAPLVFDARGEWVRERSVAALLVTDLITDHARVLHEAVARRERSEGRTTDHREPALRALEQVELPAWMRHAFELLLQRPDGTQIALAYLGHLGRRGTRADVQDSPDGTRWTAPVAALTALTAALRGAGVTVAQVHGAWLAAEQRAAAKAQADLMRNRVQGRSSTKTGARDGEGKQTLYGDGLSFLFGAAALIGDAPSAQGELTSFASWLEELFVGRDPGLDRISNGTSLTEARLRFGFLLSRLEKPGDLLRSMYARLEPQRRRALFPFRYSDYPHDVESIALLYISLDCATNWLEHDRANAESARELFFWIYAAARRLWLTAGHDFLDAKKQLATACFAFMPLLFGESLGEALKRTLSPIANNASMLAEAGAMVARNGVDPAKVAALFLAAGADLTTALRDVKQWSELTGRKEDFPEHLQKFAEKLEIDFAQPPAEPAPADPWQALRETFATAVPWGAALLQRLSEDGLTNIRPVPQDQHGTTWVLQGTLLESLRARFALAPEIRILALHGTIRGHDLRRAVELPEGIEAVDPDLLVVASATPELDKRLARIAGPWGQRIPWPFAGEGFAPLEATLTEHLPAFDIFANRDPVRGRAFLGRAQEIEDISKRLLQGQAAGVFGLRKVGKSSLLQAVADRIDPVGGALAARGRRARIAGGAAVEALVVWLDVQSLMVRTREALAERLRDALKERLDLAGLSPLAAPAPEAPGTAVTLAPTRDELSPDLDPLEGLRQLLSRALAQPEGLPVCFILDEYDLLFEGYGDEGGIPGAEQILGLFRSLSQATGRVSLALIGRDPVFVEKPHLNGFTNPLLGWVQPFFVGPFADEDAAAVLEHLGRRVGLSVGPATVSLARRWTGNHPLLLREFGAALYALARKAHMPTPVAADALGEAAALAFLRRDAVQTICGEVEVLLDVRFPEALTLLRALASAEEERAAQILGRKQGAEGRAAKVLEEFGLVRGGAEGPWVPRVYRDHFRAVTPKPRSMEWSASHGK